MALPPGSTPGDVDDRMGEPETAAVAGAVTVSVEVEVDPHATPDEKEDALLDALELDREVINVEVVDTR